MNLILLFEEDFVDDARTRVRLEGRRHRHLRKVLRASIGDRLTVGLVNGSIGEGRVLELDRESVELEISLGSEPPSPLDLVLVLALPRPPVLRRVLIAATTMGVKQIELIGAERVEKSFWQSHATEPGVIREQLKLGLEQARDTRMPEVRLHPRFDSFARERLPELVADRTGFVADPSGAVITNAAWPRRTLLAVGPEGGWASAELERFEGAGLRTVGLGERILRIETALAVLLGRAL